MITGLSYLLASITIALLLGLGSRQRHESRDDLDIYFYPRALLWALALLTPVPAMLGAFLYWTWSPTNKPTGVGLIVLIAVSGCAVLTFLCVYWYTRMFRVELTDGALTITTWRGSRKIVLGDIVDVNVFDGRTVAGGTKRLVVYLRDGRRLGITGTLTDFDDLAGSLQSQIARAQRGSNGSNAKSKDIEDSIRNKSRETLFAYVGLGIVAVAMLIIWKLARY
jgi:hypothetical protein